MGFNSEFLANNSVILILSVLPAVFASIVIALSFRPPLDRIIIRWRLPLIVLTYLVTRIILFFVIYIIFGDKPVSNDNEWWQWIGLGALNGELPYRDFRCSHSPLFPYLMAIPFSMWNQDGSAVMIFVAFDLVCIALLYKLSKLVMSVKVAQDVVWLWVVNPVVWITTVRYAQDETIIVTFLLLAAYLYMRDTRWWYAMIFALGVLFTKFTTAAGMFVVYSFSRNKLRDALVAGVLMVVVLSIFTVQGADLTIPVRSEGATIEGVSITVVLDRLTGQAITSDIYGICTLIAFFAFGVMLFVCHRRRLSVLDTLCVCLMALMLFSPKAWKFYRLWYMGPLTLWTVKNGRYNRYAVYSSALCLFDDFSFYAKTAPAILAIMYVFAIAIIVLEIRYILDILGGSKSNRSDAVKQPGKVCVEA